MTLTVDTFPYPEKTNYVFTRSTPPPDTPHVRFISGDIAAFVRVLKEEPGKDIWLVGGGQINTIMLNAGLIDELILTVFPPRARPWHSPICTGRHALRLQDRELRDLRDRAYPMALGEGVGTHQATDHRPPSTGRLFRVQPAEWCYSGPAESSI